MFLLNIRFDVPEDRSWESLRERLLARYALYRSVPGLWFHTFVLNEDERRFAGVFFFYSVEDAYRYLRSDLFLDAADYYGAEPRIEIDEVLEGYFLPGDPGR